LAAIAPARELAWDCGTGNGQAAVDLAAHFRHVVATDASADQIENAIAHERVSYRVALAERSGLESSSVDLVTVAQALHWFDLPAFFAEVRRVLVPRGVVAAWCYGLLEVDERIDAILRRFYEETVGPFWAPARRLVDTGYQTIAFPFDEVPIPPFAIERELTLDQLAAYLRTWSAVRKYAEQRGDDPVAALTVDIGPLWGVSTTTRRVRWPISMRVGRRAVDA
jgi:SAM-dependent methyltransferase